jgi:hypothetical protein
MPLLRSPASSARTTCGAGLPLLDCAVLHCAFNILHCALCIRAVSEPLKPEAKERPVSAPVAVAAICRMPP